MKSSIIKIVAFVVAITSALFAVSSCDKSENESKTVLSTLEASAKQTETVEETKSEPTTQPPIIKTDVAIQTKLFDISITEELSHKVSYEINKYEEDDSYGIYFQHNKSYENDFGGHLFSIEVHHENEGYSEMLEEYSPAPFKLAGILTAEGENYEVIITYPSDVQYDEKYKSEYEEIVNSVDLIIDTIKPIDGASFKKL